MPDEKITPLSTIMQRLPTFRMRRLKLKDALQIEIVILVMIIFGVLLPQSAPDMLEYFIPLGKGCFSCAFNPWYTSWLFFPFTLIPFVILRPLWAGVTTASFLWASNKLGSKWWVVVLAFPMVAQLWLGQVDAFVVVGLVLALCSKNPYVRGIGIVLASIKPQNSAIAILILLWHDDQRWKTLIVPAAVFAASLIVWGLWPIQWAQQMLDIKLTFTRVPEWNKAAIYPYGLVFFPTILLFKTARDRITTALLVSALALPWFGVYAYTVFLVFFAPWWAVPLSYLWLIGLPFFGGAAIRIAWILPLSLLGTMLYPRIREWWEKRRNQPADLPAQPDSIGEL